MSSVSAPQGYELTPTSHHLENFPSSRRTSDAQDAQRQKNALSDNEDQAQDDDEEDADLLPTSAEPSDSDDHEKPPSRRRSKGSDGSISSHATPGILGKQATLPSRVWRRMMGNMTRGERRTFFREMLTQVSRNS